MQEASAAAAACNAAAACDAAAAGSGSNQEVQAVHERSNPSDLLHTVY